VTPAAAPGAGGDPGCGSRRRGQAGLLAAVLVSIALTGSIAAAAAIPAATTEATGRPAASATGNPPDRPALNSRILQAGAFRVGQGDSSAALGIELRFDRRARAMAAPERCRVDPRIGIMATSDGAVYLHGGLGLAIRLPGRHTLTVGLEAGLYENRQDRDLGGPVEFRSSIELTRELAGGRRAGAVLQHLSNARLYERNPGINSLLALWAF